MRLFHTLILFITSLKISVYCQDVLPFPEPPQGGTKGPTMAESTHKWRETPSRLPKDAPNIIFMMIDDVGFGMPDTYGGPVHTPTLTKIRDTGISYNRFHTTAMCSPTRAALLTGRNHNRVNAGQITEFSNDWDGYTGIIPQSSATIAEVLQAYGYGTAAFGKDHNTPVDQIATGPFTRDPTGRGFDYFYGFLAGESSQWEPTLWENTRPIDYPRPTSGNYEDYHLTEDMAEKAIKWMHRSKALHPERPFFMWWTPGATHAPHHVAQKWADKYKGKFDGGWDKMQADTFERQKKLGFIPKNAKRSPRPEAMRAWNDIPEEEKAFQIRLMEVYAGFLEHTDTQFGKIVDELEAMNIRDNTLIFYILADNGASAEGVDGTIAELLVQNGLGSTIKDHLKVIEEQGGLSKMGTPFMDNMYNAAWAWAGCSPFRYTKLVAADFGGTRTPMAVSWPNKIKPDTKWRTQFHHVNDLAPTIYEILNIPHPKVVNGFEQDPIDGTSFAYTFAHPTAADRKETQYFDIFGSRGVYHKGWLASTFGPRTPWIATNPDLRNWDPNNDEWELFDVNKDFSLSNNLASKYPQKLKEMQDLFMKEAEENKDLPIGGGLYTLLNPHEMRKSPLTEWTLSEGMTRIPESLAPNVRNRNVRVDIDAEIPSTDVNGVIFSIGAYTGGATLYAMNGELKYEYSSILLERYHFDIGALPSGKVKISYEMKTQPGWAGPADLEFWINDTNMGTFTVGRTVPTIFTGAETFDVGMDYGSPVSLDYHELAPFPFEGKLNKLHFEYLDVKKDKTEL